MGKIMKTERNPVTGDLLKTKTGNEDAYKSGWDLIWGKTEKEDKKDGDSQN